MNIMLFCWPAWKISRTEISRINFLARYLGSPSKRYRALPGFNCQPSTELDLAGSSSELPASICDKNSTAPDVAVVLRNSLRDCFILGSAASWKIFIYIMIIKNLISSQKLESIQLSICFFALKTEHESLE